MLSLSILLPATALTRYDDHGEPLLRTSERLLVAMRRLGWVTRSEINEALGLEYDADDRVQLDAVTTAIRDVVASGKMLRRVANGRREYRIDTAAFGTQRPRGRGGRKRSI